MKRKKCNFKLPKPFVVLSTRAKRKNNHRLYVIYPPLNRFKRACFKCPYRVVNKKRSSCSIGDEEFPIKFYGLDNTLNKGVYLSVGGIPQRIGSHALRVRIEAYLKYHSQRSKRIKRILTIN